MAIRKQQIRDALSDSFDERGHFDAEKFRSALPSIDEANVINVQGLTDTECRALASAIKYFLWR